MQEIVKNFTLIHIDAPGQDEEASAYPSGYEIKAQSNFTPTPCHFKQRGKGKCWEMRS